MTQLERGVSYGRGFTVAFDAVRFLLSASQVRPDVVDHVLTSGRPLSANGVGFHILVGHLIRIEVRAVGEQKDESELGRVFVDPLLCFSGSVDRNSVHDHEELSFRLPLETPHEVNRHVRVELAREQTEANLALVGNCRYHGAASALTAARDHGGVPFHTGIVYESDDGRHMKAPGYGEMRPGAFAAQSAGMSLQSMDLISAIPSFNSVTLAMIGKRLRQKRLFLSFYS